MEIAGAGSALRGELEDVLSLLPEAEAALFKLTESAHGRRVTCEQNMDIEFLNSGSGISFCLDSLRRLVLLTAATDPSLEEFPLPILALRPPAGETKG